MITKEQLEQIIELARPLSEWLQNNYHPHSAIVVEGTFVKLIEDVAGSSIPLTNND